MNSEENLAERVKPSAILTGPTSGLGRALLDRFVGLDLNVVAIGRKMERINSVDESLSSKLCRIECDFSDLISMNILGQIRSAVKAAAMNSDSQHLIFVSNAGIVGPIGKAVRISMGELEFALRVNFLSPLAIAQLLASLAEELGMILLLVNISTGATARPIKGWLSYCTSKRACKMAMDVLAEENQHIELIHYDPGVIDTEMQHYIRNQKSDDMPDVELFREFKTKKTLSSPDEVSVELIKVILDRIK